MVVSSIPFCLLVAESELAALKIQHTLDKASLLFRRTRAHATTGESALPAFLVPAHPGLFLLDCDKLTDICRDKAIIVIDKYKLVSLLSCPPPWSNRPVSLQTSFHWREVSLHQATQHSFYVQDYQANRFYVVM